jgi:hypothetical protein
MNTQLYPLDYPQIAESGSSALEQAIRDVQKEAKLTAIRNGLSRLIAGQGLARNQGYAVPSYGIPLPANKVGVIQAPLRFRGTKGYFVGGNNYVIGILNGTSINSITFASEIVRALSTHLTDERQWPGTTGNRKSGYAAGGWGDRLTSTVRSCDRIDYLGDVALRLGINLSETKFIVSAIGSRFFGYFAGGLVQWATTSRFVDRISYTDPEIVEPKGNALATARACGLDSAGTPTKGYYFGGAVYGALGWSPLFSIETITFAGEVFAVLARSLSWAHVGHATGGNERRALIIGGWSSTISWFSDSENVSEFLFATEVPTLLGKLLSISTTAACAPSTSVSCYAGSGMLPIGSAPANVFKIEKFNFEPVAKVPFGVRLAVPTPEAAALSDYGATFSF